MSITSYFSNFTIFFFFVCSTQVVAQVQADTDHNTVKDRINEYSDGRFFNKKLRQVDLGRELISILHEASGEGGYEVEGTFYGVRLYYASDDDNLQTILYPLDDEGNPVYKASGLKNALIDERFFDPCPKVCDRMNDTDISPWSGLGDKSTKFFIYILAGLVPLLIGYFVGYSRTKK